MVGDKKHLKEVLNFIREHRSNESNFDKLYAKLIEESDNKQFGLDKEGENNYQDKLLQIKERQAVTYQQSKEESGSAWPEFENFVSLFERSIADALKEK